MTWRWASLLLAGGAVGGRAVLASEGGHGHAAGIPWGTLALSTINLAIFLWVLARFVLPAVREWVRERRVRVVTALEEAATAKAEAMRLKAEWEERLARLVQTVEAMRQQAQQDAERERVRIIAAAQKTADAILRDAERAAASEAQRVQDMVRAAMVREAVQRAEAQLRTAWTAADQAQSVDDFVKQVRA